MARSRDRLHDEAGRPPLAEGRRQPPPGSGGLGGSNTEPPCVFAGDAWAPRLHQGPAGELAGEMGQIETTDFSAINESRHSSRRIDTFGTPQSLFEWEAPALTMEPWQQRMQEELLAAVREELRDCARQLSLDTRRAAKETSAAVRAEVAAETALTRKALEEDIAAAHKDIREIRTELRVGPEAALLLGEAAAAAPRPPRHGGRAGSPPAGSAALAGLLAEVRRLGPRLDEATASQCDYILLLHLALLLFGSTPRHILRTQLLHLVLHDRPQILHATRLYVAIRLAHGSRAASPSARSAALAELLAEVRRLGPRLDDVQAEVRRARGQEASTGGRLPRALADGGPTEVRSELGNSQARSSRDHAEGLAGLREAVGELVGLQAVSGRRGRPGGGRISREDVALLSEGMAALLAALAEAGEAMRGVVAAGRNQQEDRAADAKEEASVMEASLLSALRLDGALLRRELAAECSEVLDASLDGEGAAAPPGPPRAALAPAQAGDC
ncbi:unnamed protein product [Prorocentrum cordatum]|uniref:Uncharacterized protein n=1 Tax=Prorocentrum cordatum TaxID=2364126 RepID=A0ABN9WMU6_9DINO|nr:unnamed protein product [Polarella glacialis]